MHSKNITFNSILEKPIIREKGPHKDFLLSEEKTKKPEEKKPSVQLPSDPPNPS